MSGFFIDTSLILDGELYSREPEKLPRYMLELVYSCSSLLDLASHASVKRVVTAYEWSKKFRSHGGRLLITPRVELDCAPQVNLQRVLYYAASYLVVFSILLSSIHYLQCERMDWVEDLGEVGIEDVHRLDLVVSQRMLMPP